MSQPVVLYDACVLYPAPLRSFLMHLTMTGLYKARWSDDIHEEWMRNVEKDYPDISRGQVEKIRDLMNAHVDDCLATGYEALIPSLALPDPNDRHVLAAAIQCGANIILTFNLADFPEAHLQPHGLKAICPDDFLVQQMGFASDMVCEAARRQRSSLKNPPLTVEEYLRTLERQGLKQTTARLRELTDFI